MRDYVEIGLGREARRAYDLGDLSIVPKLSLIHISEPTRPY